MQKTSFRSTVMTLIVCLVVACLTSAPSSSPCQKKVWRSGTILKVKARPDTTHDGNRLPQYEVSIGVGGKIYVTLYAPPKNKPDPSYYVGMSVAVSVEGTVLRFNDLRGNTRTARILSCDGSPPRSE